MNDQSTYETLKRVRPVPVYQHGMWRVGAHWFLTRAEALYAECIDDTDLEHQEKGAAT